MIRSNARRPGAPRILSVKRAMPAHHLDQETILKGLLPLLATDGTALPLARIEQLHRSVQVERRHLAAAPEEYVALDTFSKRNAVWTKVAMELGEEAVRGALAAAGLEPRDVDHIFFTTVTGIAVPS
ncbi:MAG: type III polyketide synthase, partial [Planctomycetota bacterium]